MRSTSDSLLRFADFNTEHRPRPYSTVIIQPHPHYSAEERHAAAQSAGWNVFNFPARMVTHGDFLSDSGTGALTLEQLSGIINGLGTDNAAYGTRSSYEMLINALGEYLGVKEGNFEIFLTNQGRAAEAMFFETLRSISHPYVCPIIPSNGHFDTTRANIEWVGYQAIDVPSRNACDKEFQGNMDINALEDLLTKNPEIPVVFLTITNNTYGGLPVSLAHIREVRSICHKHRAALFLDACRFAENAWFINQHEEGQKGRGISAIVKDMFSVCDGFTISFKKDGLSHTGGALAVRRVSPLTRKTPQLLESLRDYQTLKIAHQTQGGMTGRDHLSIVHGLGTTTSFAYLEYRTSLTRRFAEFFEARGVPIVTPIGGHAVYVDIDRFFEGTRIRREDYGGIALTALLLLKGIRACELGAFAFGRYNQETGTETFLNFNFVRFALPRLRYEEEDLRYAADCVVGLYAMRDHFPRAVPTHGREKTLRHFKARFELVPFDR